MTSATDAQREYHNLTTFLDPDREKKPDYGINSSLTMRNWEIETPPPGGQGAWIRQAKYRFSL